MKKITTKQITELANKALAAGNPYEEKATKYFIGYTPMFLYAGEHMTMDVMTEMNKMCSAENNYTLSVEVTA